LQILHINDHLSAKGGVETYLLSVVPELAQRGYKSHIAFGKGEPGASEYSHHLPEIASASYRSEVTVHYKLTRLLKELKPELVHLHGIQNLAVFQVCLDASQVVMTGHDYRTICPVSNLFYKRTKAICSRVCGPMCFPITALFHCMTPRPRWASYFYRRCRWIMKNAVRFSHLIAPSTGAKERFIQAGFSPDRVTVNPYFCSLKPAQEPRPVPSQPLITFIGRASDVKGWEYFIDALGKLPDSVRGLIVGNFDFAHKELKRLAAASGCPDRLEVKNWASREKISGILRKSTVFVFPSIWPETLGIVGLEAMACGVPVVASDVGGVREWLHDGENGILVPPKSGRRIAEAARNLIDDKEMNLRLGAAGLQTIRSHFLPEHHIKILTDVYEKAVSGA
jgi:glycosyltransferase involved in cell wall biosynthesis